ncbi:endonuclease-reverse transcriptase [Elysia marginata]|uniref:Endonuclease-reverse transcriptase n=1 Tax=Elysia marginata TaxID=1093978 RepID=A0AAV4K164_9GAST|nr:endonuclease-reverse transcriptase [Elysia marginata]
MNSNSAVFLNNTIGNSFKTAVGVRQGCLLSPVLFNIFLERIMQDTLHQHSPTISIGGRPIFNLRFADDIDLSNSRITSRIAGPNRQTGGFFQSFWNGIQCYNYMFWIGKARRHGCEEGGMEGKRWTKACHAGMVCVDLRLS